MAGENILKNRRHEDKYRILIYIFILMLFSPFIINAADPEIENIRWVVINQSDTFYDETSESFDKLKSLGVQAIIEVIPWTFIESTDNNFNWFFPRRSMERAQAAGLIWIPQIGIHYAPNWLINSDVNYHWIHKNGSYDGFDNLGNPPNIFHPNTLFYVDRFINAFFDEFSDQNFPLIYLSTGSLGETYFPGGPTYPAFDANTINAWRSFTGDSNALPYSGQFANDGSGASHAVFIDWWYNQMYVYIDHIYSLAHTRDPSAGKGLKISYYPAIGQIPEEQAAAVMQYNLQVISYGGPLAQFSAGSQVVAEIAHQNNIYGWVESFIDVFNGIDQTPEWTRDKINEYNLDGYMYATIFNLLTNILANPPFQEKDQYYKYQTLINYFPDTSPPAAVADLNYSIDSINGASAQVLLTWTAPGDDGNYGTAFEYAFRYRVNEILSQSNWVGAVNIGNEPSPSVAGSSESLTFTASLGNNYSFGMVSRDTAGNWAGLSNITNVDISAPDAVSDLAVVAGELELSSITLEWTSSGDDGAYGTATTYDLRYSTTQIVDDTDFTNATLIVGEPIPQSSGNTERFTLNGLNKNTTYWFALKVVDDTGAISSLSNIVSQATPADTDDDGLSDADETTNGTLINNPDSDGDGVTDLHEILAGTNPNDNTDFSDNIFQDNFSDGNYNGWTSAGSVDISWDASSEALVASAIGGPGYSTINPDNFDISGLSSLAVSYDVTFSNGAVWGAIDFRGIRLDVNPIRTGWRDDSSQWYGGISSNLSHHVLLIIRFAGPYYLSDLYIDGELRFENEPIEEPTWKNNTIALVSPHSNGNVSFDNFIVWGYPQSLLVPFMDNFSSNSLGPWIVSGSSVNWLTYNGIFEANKNGSGYSYAKHALIDVSSKDLIIEYDVGHYGGSIWGGFVYRDIFLDVNINRSGWRDGTFQWYSGFASNELHHITLVVQQDTPYYLSTLYFNNNTTPVFLNEPIEVGSYSKDLIGLVSSYYLGDKIHDNFSVTAVDTGGNLPPIVFPIKTQYIEGGSTINFSVVAVDPENSPLNYSYTSTDLPGSGPTLDGNSGLFQWATQVSDVGIYNVTIMVDDGPNTTLRQMQIIVTIAADTAIIFEEDFAAGFDPNTDNWTLSGSNNATWDYADEELKATVNGTNYGYSYDAPMSIEGAPINGITSIDEVALEYDVSFNNGAKWGGFAYGGVSLDVNVNRTGFRDGVYQWYSGLSAGTTHHITFLMHTDNTSDLYIDSIPIFTAEPIDTAFTNDTIIFISPYLLGDATIDNIHIYDLGLLSSSSLFVYDDFSQTNLNDWIILSGSSSKNWTIEANQLVVRSLASGYSSLELFAMDVSDKNITIDYKVNFQDGASWGGIRYRGIVLDINPNRSGWRDGNYQWYTGLSANVEHDIRLVIQQSSPDDLSTLYIDNNLIFQNEPIQTSYTSNSVGFFSHFANGRVIIDNFKIEEN